MRELSERAMANGAYIYLHHTEPYISVATTVLLRIRFTAATDSDYSLIAQIYGDGGGHGMRLL